MRKIIQIVHNTNNRLYAVCDDGTVWYSYMDGPWKRVNDIPQDKSVEVPSVFPEKEIRSAPAKPCVVCRGEGGGYDSGWWYECTTCNGKGEK